MHHLYTRASKLAGLTDIAAEKRDNLATRLRAAGIDPAVVRQPDATIEYAALCNLLADCAKSWDMPDLGLRIAKDQEIELLGPLSLIVRLERTVRSALNAIIENLIIYSNVTVAALDEDDAHDTATLIVDARDDAPRNRVMAELSLAQGKIVLDAIADQTVELSQAEFRHRKGTSARAVSRHFGCPIQYNAPRNAISFERSILDRRLQRNDMAYHPLIKRYIATARSETGAGQFGEIRSEVARQLELSTCSLENVSRALRMNPRSLQRILKAQGTSFRDLTDEWRRARALSLLTNTRLPLSDVSAALGYAEQSVFTQAFRRWYGRTPLQCRKEAALPTM